MPGYNRKGPQGEGPMTGRGLGKCNSKRSETDNDVSLDETPIRRRRRIHSGRGKNRGLGLGNGRNRRN
jgi:hypothetical protein